MQEANGDAPEAKKKKEEDLYKEIKKVPKPDDQANKDALAAEADEIAKKQKRLEEIKKLLEVREGTKIDSNSEFGIAKTKFNDTRAVSRRLQQASACGRRRRPLSASCAAAGRKEWSVASGS